MQPDSSDAKNKLEAIAKLHEAVENSQSYFKSGKYKEAEYYLNQALEVFVLYYVYS